MKLNDPDYMLVRVVDYDPKWPGMFEAEAALVREIMGDNLITIFHIGSTAVPGLLTREFAAAGYEAMGEFGLPGRRYFRKGGANRTHQIHAYQYDSVHAITRHVIYRDYMRAHAEAREAYGGLKAELASRFPDDVGAYCDGKDAFVKEYERRALIWYWERLSAVRPA